MTFDVEVSGRVFRIEVSRHAGKERITVDGRPVRLDVAPSGRSWSLLVGHRSHEVSIADAGDGTLLVYVDHQLVRATVTAGAASRSRTGGEPVGGDQRNGPRRIVAPMPGRIVKVMVRSGDEVRPQQPLLVIEAMKMENELRSATGGMVTDVRVAEGALVESGAVLMTIE